MKYENNNLRCKFTDDHQEVSFHLSNSLDTQQVQDMPDIEKQIVTAFMTCAEWLKIAAEKNAQSIKVDINGKTVIDKKPDFDTNKNQFN